MAQHINLNPIQGLTTTAPTITNNATVTKPISVVETYYNSTTKEWYRKYSDGWIEQGGYCSTPTQWNDYDTHGVTFKEEFTAAPLMIHCIETVSGTSSGYQGLYSVEEVSTSGFTLRNCRTGNKQTGFYWTAKGI